MPHPAARFTVADVLRDHVAGLRLGDAQHRVVCHLLGCRTGQLGGHRAVCDRCGATHFAYHSCRDRHCPTCGGLDQALWAEAQTDHLLPVSYFHLVFTLPACLRPFFTGPQRRHALEALFAAVAATLLEVGERNLGARLGLLAVLHTWTQKLDHLHPHLHCLVPGGGLADDRWVDRRSYLLPKDKLAVVFSAKMREALETLVAAGTLTAGRYSARTLLQAAAQSDWVIYAKRPLAGPEQVISYFARYTRRIAISNQRIVAYDGKTVRFTWRDRKQNRKRTRTVTGPTFCRLFLQHVLPPGFVRIRRYGILSNRLRERALAHAREFLGNPAPSPSRPTETRAQACFRLFGVNPTVCPTCKQGTLVLVWKWSPMRLPLAAILPAAARAP